MMESVRLAYYSCDPVRDNDSFMSIACHAFF